MSPTDVEQEYHDTMAEPPTNWVGQRDYFDAMLKAQEKLTEQRFSQMEMATTLAAREIDRRLDSLTKDFSDHDRTQMLWHEKVSSRLSSMESGLLASAEAQKRWITFMGILLAVLEVILRWWVK